MYDTYKSVIEAGTKIRVIACGDCYKKYDLIGKHGHIVSMLPYSNCNDKYAVELDGIRNNSSSLGYFYFRSNEFVIVDDLVDIHNNDILEKNTMQNVTNYLNIAKIRFVDSDSSNTYEYANFDPYLAVGDLCVVKSAHHGLGIGKVVEILNLSDVKTSREIVARVNTDAYDLRVANRARAAELKAKMKERAKQLQDIALYQMLAKDDPAMMELLEEYQALPKV